MNEEFDTVAWVKDAAGITRMIPVTVTYEVDGYKPLGLWVFDEAGADRTLDMTEAEYDMLYFKACEEAADNIRAACEAVAEGER